MRELPICPRCGTSVNGKQKEYQLVPIDRVIGLGLDPSNPQVGKYGIIRLWKCINCGYEVT